MAVLRLAGCLLVGLLSMWLLLPALAAAESNSSSPSVVQEKADKAAAAIISVGIQPMWLPGGIITEVVRRDRVLRLALQQLGKEVRFHPFLSGVEVNNALQQGELVGGVVGDMPAITACAAERIVIVALLDQNFTSIVAGKTMLPDELRGRRIGYVPGSNAHYALLNTLKAYRIPLADVTLQSMPLQAMAEALAEGRIDAFSAWEPTPALAIKRYKHTVIHRQLTSGYWYFTNAFVQQHPEEVALFLAAELRALHWLTQSDDHLLQAVSWSEAAIRDLTGRTLALAREDIFRLVRRSLHALAVLPLLPEDELQEEGRLGKAVEFLQSLGNIPPGFTWQHMLACLDRSRGEAVLAAQQRYRTLSFDYEE
ncbi:MAG: NrtA/SsuA/CpmA family ABC transporter substrate-binding protein [Magnetococcales bacterium]|nr:NrtA/SsuA/CpmA family ABC transporter substrate-binding protein [Magnetococcales bacterium]